MAALNDKASEAMQEIGVHACTDITGFGFLGHIIQLAKNSNVGLAIDSKSVPYFSEAKSYAESGYLPGGLTRNHDFYSPDVIFSDNVPQFLRNILFDPQTSGGLLICVSAGKVRKLINTLNRSGKTEAVIVGKVVAGRQGVVEVI